MIQTNFLHEIHSNEVQQEDFMQNRRLEFFVSPLRDTFANRKEE
jgi:hypothetical protein